MTNINLVPVTAIWANLALNCEGVTLIRVDGVWEVLVPAPEDCER